MNSRFGTGKKLRFPGMIKAAAAIMALTIMAQGPAALAAELTMTTDGNLRKEASTSSDKVGKASNGSTYTIESETTGSDGNKWYQITVNGTTGYVREDLVRVSDDGGGDAGGEADAPATSSVAAVSVRQDATVRAEANDESASVTEAMAGTQYNVSGEVRDGAGDLWYEVDAGGQTGFIRESYVDTMDTPASSDGGGGASGDNTTTISSVVSSRILPEGTDLENMSIDLATLQSWESGNYYVLYTKSTNDDSDPGEWYLYSLEDNQFQRIASLDSQGSQETTKAKKPLFKGNNRLILIIAGVLVVAIILAVIFLIIRSRESRSYGGMDPYDDDDDDEDDEDDEDDRYRVPVKRGARPAPSRGQRGGTTPRNFMSRNRDDEYDDDMDDMEDDDMDDGYDNRRGRRVITPERQTRSRGGVRPARSRRRYEEEEMDEEEYMDDDDFEFEFLNDK